MHDVTAEFDIEDWPTLTFATPPLGEITHDMTTRPARLGSRKRARS